MKRPYPTLTQTMDTFINAIACCIGVVALVTYTTAFIYFCCCIWMMWYGIIL